MRKGTRSVIVLLFPSFWLIVQSAPALARARAGIDTQSRPPRLEDIRKYISAGWGVLTRSETKCETFSDPKTGGKSVLYFPAEFSIPAAAKELEKRCSIRVEHLPAVIEKLGGIDVSGIRPHGLLYLENPYVVPGGMFNEMYGWDSYFILRGLLREGKLDLARGMAENFFFEIDHYGGVLNANRTYYLTRSQPPFLTSMILAVYDAEQARVGEVGAVRDLSRFYREPPLEWLAKAYPYAVKDYELWTHPPHLAGDTGLSRYLDFGEGPVPELGDDAGPYFRRVLRYFLLHPEVGQFYIAETAYLMAPIEKLSASSLVGPVFSLKLCYAGTIFPPGLTAPPPPLPPAGENCEPLEYAGLTADFYKGDRSMRESGFDVSFRFEPYSAGTHHYAPVCLNSLLYKVEKNLERISAVLSREQESREWGQRALNRQETVTKYLWNEERGLFFDYNFTTRTQSSYEFATTFYPLWVGLASPRQAQALVKNLKLFEQAGGLAMSRQETTAQWDYPYGWAPIHLIAIEGLRRYGFQVDANRISYNFLSIVLENFRRDGTIREKYNVVTRSSETHVEAGYKENVIGFGWTNGVFLELLYALPKEWVTRLGQLSH